MAVDTEVQAFLAPLVGADPCGVDLDEAGALSAFDSLRVFGTLKSPDAGDNIGRWQAIRQQAAEALAKSKDIRVLAYWSAAVTHIDGWAGLEAGLKVAAAWLTDSFEGTYPRPDGKDVVLRKNTLVYFADRVAVLDALRRAPLASVKQRGTVSLRDIALSNGEMSPVDAEQTMPGDLIASIFSETPIGDLEAVAQNIDGADQALHKVDEAMRGFGGAEAAPSLDALAGLIDRARTELATQIDVHPSKSSDGTVGGVSVSIGRAASASGQGSGRIASREDAIRALDAVASYFRGSEPSSPVPLIVDRAKRLIGKNFLEALEEVAPTGLTEAKSAGGVRDA